MQEQEMGSGLVEHHVSDLAVGATATERKKKNKGNKNKKNNEVALGVVDVVASQGCKGDDVANAGQESDESEAVLETDAKTYRAYKFPLKRLKPAQEKALHRIRRLCCELYNACLQERRDAYQKQGVTITNRGNRSKGEKGQQAALVEIKQLRPEYAEVHSSILQNVTLRVDLAYKAFFKRAKERKVSGGSGPKAGFPRFKRLDQYLSFKFAAVSQGPRVMRGGGVSYAPAEEGKPRKLIVHGVPGAVQVHWYREMQGTPKTAEFLFERNKWHVVFACEGVPPEKVASTGERVGVDLGLLSFLALDNGECVPAPKFLRQHEKRLKMEQKSLSRKKRGSKRRRKQRERVARLHLKVANSRREFHHALARRLVRSYDEIAIEDLKVLALSRSRLAKSVNDAGWSSFVSILTQKAQSCGKVVVRVDPAYTSQDCSRCGHRAPKELSERVHRCEKCGLELDRDVNAARNIRYRAFPQAAHSERLED